MKLTDDDVRRELEIAREAMGSTKTTREQWDRIGVGLGHILVVNEMSRMAKTWLEATIEEYTHRKVHMEVKWMGEDEAAREASRSR